MSAPSFRGFRHKWFLAEAIDEEQDEIPVFAHAELGVSPDTELVHMLGVVDWQGSRQRWAMRRGQGGTDAADWPVGTPLTWLPVDGWTPPDPNVQTLSKALPASAGTIDLRHTYRRLKFGSEIMWQFSGPYGGTSETIDVQRAKEGTTAAVHAEGATGAYLAAGES